MSEVPRKGVADRRVRMQWERLECWFMLVAPVGFQVSDFVGFRILGCAGVPHL